MDRYTDLLEIVREIEYQLPSQGKTFSSPRYIFLNFQKIPEILRNPPKQRKKGYNKNKLNFFLMEYYEL